MTKKNLVVLSAGGTGGHMFPALALHNALASKNIATRFITDDRGFRWLPKDQDLKITIVQASAIHAGFAGKIKSAIKISLGTLKSLLALLLNRPSVIVGFGGYPSFPALLAAHLLRIPIILHEQNAIFGRANRVVAPWTKKIALSFPETLNLPPSLKGTTTLIGNPPQQKAIGLADVPYPKREKNDPFKLIILGGSQGAKIFGDIVHKAIALLPEETKAVLSIVQQCLEEDIPTVEAGYETMNVNARVEPFIKDYMEQISQAHLIISRAGAGSVSLYANLGRPAIYVPLAISLDGDQAQNAKNMIDVSGGWILEEKSLSPTVLASKLEELINAPQHLKNAAEKAKTLSQLDATEKFVTLVETYI